MAHRLYSSFIHIIIAGVCTKFDFSWVFYVYCIVLLGFWTENFGRLPCLIFFLLFYSLHIWSYYKIIFTSPGHPPAQHELQSIAIHSSTDQYEEQILNSESDPISSLMAKRNGQIRNCRKCQTQKPDRSHHCSVCQECVLRMDHHCPWVNNCVGFHNHKFFFLFLFWAVVLCLYVALSLLPIVANFKVYIFDVQVYILMLVSVVFGLTLFLFTGFHLYLILKNKTTIENMETPRYRLPTATTSSPPSLHTGNHSPVLNRLFGRNVQQQQRPTRTLPNIYDLGCRRNWEMLMGKNPWTWFIPVETTIGTGLEFEYNEEAFDIYVQVSQNQQQQQQ